ELVELATQARCGAPRMRKFRKTESIDHATNAPSSAPTWFESYCSGEAPKGFEEVLASEK
ncbi:MAG: hypothetical protein ACHREM_23525, partial [Polyangiales bacterium]